MKVTFATVIALSAALPLLDALKCITLGPPASDGTQTSMSQDFGDTAKACIRYEYTCTAQDNACTDAEKQAQATKITYAIWSEPDCATLKTMTSMYRNLLCCTTDNCNSFIGSTPTATTSRTGSVKVASGGAGEVSASCAVGLFTAALAFFV